MGSYTLGGLTSNASFGDLDLPLEEGEWAWLEFNIPLNLTLDGMKTLLMEKTIVGVEQEGDLALQGSARIAKNLELLGNFHRQDSESNLLTQPLDNRFSTAQPSTDDNASKGYSRGSIWREFDDEGWIADWMLMKFESVADTDADVEVGDAVWERIKAKPVDLYDALPLDSSGFSNLTLSNDRRFSEFEAIYINTIGRLTSHVAQNYSQTTPVASFTQTNGEQVINMVDLLDGTRSVSFVYASDTQFRFFNSGGGVNMDLVVFQGLYTRS